MAVEVSLTSAATVEIVPTVDDSEIGIEKVCREPFGRREKLRMGIVGHWGLRGEVEYRRESAVL
jgi:hypothetical protein